MKSTRDREAERLVGESADATRCGPGSCLPKPYAKPELISYGNLVDLTRAVGGGAPDGLIGTIGT